jgi:O-antigen/teichoic acid export membrane protein
VPTLLTRSLVLSFSRFANQAIVLISPMLLVRILTVDEYGSYQEFMLYAALIAPIAMFSVARSLQFLIPKHPDQERAWVTQTALLVLASSTVAITGIFLGSDMIRANTSFDFVVALQLYIFFFINLDFLEAYWLGKKRTDLVLYYSSGRLAVRVAVVVTAAWLTEDASSIVASLVVMEALRFLLVLWYAASRHWFTTQITRAGLALQLSYFLPLGFGTIVEVLNRRAGMLFISTVLGPAALAYFVVGSFATQIVNILRGAVSDVIFPEIVAIKTATPREALPLWQRATVLFCVFLFPVSVIFIYYGDVVVTVLFTAEYLAAVPIFSVFALLLVLDCFDFHLPLRVQNANSSFVFGNIVALVANLSLLYPAYLIFGLVGPAVSLVMSRLAFTIYLGSKAARLYRVSWRELVQWGTVAKVFGAALLCLPILVLGRFAVEHLLFRGIAFVPVYLAAYLVLLRIMGLWDALEMLTRVVGSGRKWIAGAGRDA